MDGTGKAVILEIDSRLECAALVGTSIRALCLENGIDEMTSYQIQTCVIEAVNNAIIHAYRGQPGHTVRVGWNLSDTCLTVEVSDHGATMTGSPPEDEPDPAAESGRGWWIMRQWMDRADYASEAGRNLVTLQKALG